MVPSVEQGLRQIPAAARRDHEAYVRRIQPAQGQRQKLLVRRIRLVDAVEQQDQRRLRAAVPQLAQQVDDPVRQAARTQGRIPAGALAEHRTGGEGAGRRFEHALELGRDRQDLDDVLLGRRPSGRRQAGDEVAQHGAETGVRTA